MTAKISKISAGPTRRNQTMRHMQLNVPKKFWPKPGEIWDAKPQGGEEDAHGKIGY